MGALSANLKRLKLIKPYKQAELAGFIGVTVSTWSNYEIGKTEPSLDDLVKISKFFGIPVDDLLTEGNLFKEIANPKIEEKGKGKGNLRGKPNEVKEVKYAYGNRMPKVVTVDSSGADNVVLVPVRARAGYLAGHEDPEFIQTLPSYRLPGLTHGTFRMFEVQGHSMVPTFDESDIIICRFAENFAEIRDDRIHVVVTKHDGLVVKRVVNRVSREGKLILNSDNQRHRGEYPPIIVDAEDVLELWYAVAFISRQMRSPGEIYNRLIEVESRLTLLESDHKKLLTK